MKIKTDMKLLILLTLVLSICASAVSAQKKPTATNQNIWQKIELDRWGVNFSIPKNLKAIPQTEGDEPDFSDEDFSESRTFKRSIPKAQRLELLIYLQNRKGEKVKTEFGGKEVELSAEELLRGDFNAGIISIEQEDSPVLENNYHEIDGVNGILMVTNVSFDVGKSIKPTNDIRVIWGTYRLFKGNVQQITFSIEGKRTHLETMMKIINSLKFSL